MAMSRIRLAMQYPFAHALRHEQLLDEGGFDRAIENALLSAAIGTLTEALPPMRPRIAIGRRWRCVKQACDYIEANLGGTLTMEMLCEQTRVSARTIENAFLDITGLAPRRYIKLRRLEAVRNALRVADPRETSIKAVALKFGFWHLGHFSRDYNTRFGENPSVTLERRAVQVSAPGPASASANAAQPRAFH